MVDGDDEMVDEKMIDMTKRWLMMVDEMVDEMIDMTKRW